MQHSPFDRGSQVNYWDWRAENLKWFRGDWFYTATDLPYYIYRREWFLRQLQENVDFDGKVLCEYGCGDGFNVCYLAQRFSLQRVISVDISPNMIELARQRAEQSGVAIDTAIVQGDDDLAAQVPSADIVLISMVLAHNSDTKVLSILQQVRVVSPRAVLVVFEHVDDTRREGLTWVVRPIADYEGLFSQAGYIVAKRELFSSPFYWRMGQAMRTLVWLARRFRSTADQSAKRRIPRGRSRILRLGGIRVSVWDLLYMPVVAVPRVTDRFWHNGQQGYAFWLLRKQGAEQSITEAKASAVSSQDVP